MERPLRIGVCQTLPFYCDNPSFSTINMETFVHAFRALGHDALLVCPGDSRASEGVALERAPRERYADPEYWRSLNLDIVLLLTWQRHVPELRAIQAAGIQTISKADSAGTLSLRLCPKETFSQIVLAQTDPRFRLKMLLHWCRTYLYRHRADAPEFLASADASDVIAIETITARDRVARFFAYYGRPELAQKLILCPHFVGADILTSPLPQPAQKRDKLVAIGRWDAWQKDAPLLTATLERYLAQTPQTTVTLIGKAGEEVFAGLRTRFPRVTCTGPIPREAIREHLVDARTLILTSRFESFHIAAHEALCMGATVVGPEVIPLPDITAAGAYGVLAQPRTPAALAQALADEHARWENGTHDTTAIATFWRERMDPIQRMGAVLAALPKRSG